MLKEKMECEDCDYVVHVEYEGKCHVYNLEDNQFPSFLQFVQYTMRQNAHLEGIAKVRIKTNIRESELWEKVKSLEIPSPFEQSAECAIPEGATLATGRSTEVYYLDSQPQKTPNMTVSKFKRRVCGKNKSHSNQRNKTTWSKPSSTPTLYACNIEGNVMKDFLPENRKWDPNNLQSLLDKAENAVGVQTSYLYFGAADTFFPWHTEDKDLFSVNFHLGGAEKIWYAIPLSDVDKFENLMRQVYYMNPDAINCPGFLRHKNIICSTAFLKSHGISFNTVVQRPGDIIITYPRGYHSGFNAGFNMNEASNFCVREWIPYGFFSNDCFCEIDTVLIDMISFLEDSDLGPEEKALYRKWEFRGTPPHLAYSLDANQSRQQLAPLGPFSDLKDLTKHLKTPSIITSDFIIAWKQAARFLSADVDSNITKFEADGGSLLMRDAFVFAFTCDAVLENVLGVVDMTLEHVIVRQDVSKDKKVINRLLRLLSNKDYAFKSAKILTTLLSSEYSDNLRNPSKINETILLALKRGSDPFVWTSNFPLHYEFRDFQWFIHCVKEKTYESVPALALFVLQQMVLEGMMDDWKEVLFKELESSNLKEQASQKQWSTCIEYYEVLIGDVHEDKMETDEEISQNEATPTALNKGKQGKYDLLPCPECGAKFGGSSGLTHHRKIEHKFVLPSKFECQECGTRFMSKRALLFHQSKPCVIPTKKTNICPYCNRDFKRNRARLVEHLENRKCIGTSSIAGND